MNTSLARTVLSLSFAAILLLGTSVPALAAPSPITAITTTPAIPVGNATEYLSLTSISYDLTTTSDLVAPTSVLITTSGTLDWFIPTDESIAGVTEAGALSGLVINSGIFNGSAQFYFTGQTLTLDTRFFLFDNNDDAVGAAGDPDAAEIYAIDAAGNRIATGSISKSFNLDAISDQSLFLSNIRRENTIVFNNRGVSGAVFSLRDLGYSEADFGVGVLATLGGFEMETTGLDATVAGVIVDPIPEPASLTLLGIAGMMILSRRQQASTSIHGRKN